MDSSDFYLIAAYYRRSNLFVNETSLRSLDKKLKVSVKRISAKQPLDHMQYTLRLKKSSQKDVYYFAKDHTLTLWSIKDGPIGTTLKFDKNIKAFAIWRDMIIASNADQLVFIRRHRKEHSIQINIVNNGGAGAKIKLGESLFVVKNMLFFIKKGIEERELCKFDLTTIESGFTNISQIDNIDSGVVRFAINGTKPVPYYINKTGEIFRDGKVVGTCTAARDDHEYTYFDIIYKYIFICIQTKIKTQIQAPPEGDPVDQTTYISTVYMYRTDGRPVGHLEDLEQSKSVNSEYFRVAMLQVDKFRLFAAIRQMEGFTIFAVHRSKIIRIQTIVPIVDDIEYQCVSAISGFDRNELVLIGNGNSDFVRCMINI